jgi:hypothetical protein
MYIFVYVYMYGIAWYVCVYITNANLIFYHFRITMSRLLCHQSIRPVSVQPCADQVTARLVLAIHSLIVVTGMCLVIDSKANSITTSIQECQNNSKN